VPDDFIVASVIVVGQPVDVAGESGAAFRASQPGSRGFSSTDAAVIMKRLIRLRVG
jgi:hypothetical protein